MTASCSSCNQELIPGARFCPSCGAAVVAACGSCGSELPVGAAFCPACGAEQGEDPDQPDSSEELRVLSALFADLAGFTSHTEVADPEDVRARLSVYHRRVRADVERYGGTIEKLMGDGVFAVFGFPTLHEDDPERAVRAALRIQASVEEINAADESLDLSVRIGVTSGEAIVQLAEDVADERIIGDVVNTASRLEGVAEPGSVVIDERTYLAVRNAVECDSLDPVMVKGKAAPVAIWKAVAARSRFGVGVDETGTPVFVGRESERRLLLDAFERAVAQRSTQLVTVSGEPGVGKTRLIREFFADIDDRPDLVRWRQGRNLPYGEGVTFWALSEIVKSEAGILESEAPGRAATKLRDSVTALLDGSEEIDAEWIIQRLAPLAGTGSAEGAERGELFSAWLQYFELLASRNPLVMVIEDLHWADDALAEFLEHLMEWAQDAAILIVCSTRPEWFERRPEWGGGRRQAVNVGLSPLTQDETARLVSALANRTVMPATAQQALLERSGGNPLYVTEYVRLAMEEGWLEGRFDPDSIPLPDSVQAIIAARLDRLDPFDKAVIQAAAVVGRVFWSGAVTFARNSDEAATHESLRRLARRELIQPVRRPSMEGQDEYTFAHVLARDVAYAQLPRSEKARLHRETARWLEAVSAGRMVDVAELLAHHHVTALALEPSDDAELLGRVHRFLMLAGERSERLDLGRGAAFYERAAELAATLEDRARALLARGKITYGLRHEVTSVLTRAIEAFEEIGDVAGAADALNQRSGVHWWGGDKASADADLAAALELVEQLEPSVLVADVLVSAGFRHQLSGREEEALETVERAMAIARQVGDTDNYARALRARGSALTQMGVADGLGDVREALRIDLDRGSTAAVMSGYNNIATYLGYMGEALQAIEVIDEAISYGLQRSAGGQVEWSKMTKCESLVQIGDVAAIERLSQELIVADDARGGTQVGMFARQFAAWATWARGDAAAAWAEQRRVAESSYVIDDPQVTVPNLALAIALAHDAAELKSAAKYVDDFISIAIDNPGFVVGHLTLAAPALIAAGRADDVLAITEIAHTPTPWSEASMSAAQALVAEHRGDPEAALAALLDAIDVADQLGLEFFATWMRVEASRGARAAGDHDTSVTLAADARTAADRMGARRFSQMLDELEGGVGSALGR